MYTLSLLSSFPLFWGALSFLSSPRAKEKQGDEEEEEGGKHIGPVLLCHYQVLGSVSVNNSRDEAIARPYWALLFRSPPPIVGDVM